MEKWLWHHILCSSRHHLRCVQGQSSKLSLHWCTLSQVYIFFFQQSLALSNHMHLISNYSLAMNFLKSFFWNSKLKNDLVGFFSLPWLNSCHWLSGWGARDKGFVGRQIVGCISHKCVLYYISIRFPVLAEGKPMMAKCYKIFMLWHRYSYFTYKLHGPQSEHDKNWTIDPTTIHTIIQVQTWAILDSSLFFTPHI